jgi:predicted transcriptional regulator
MAATPQRTIRLSDDVWEPFQELAARRDVTASWLVKQLIVAEVHRARESGELPKRRRSK